MRTNLFLCLCLVSVLIACVQKTHRRTVVYRLHLPDPTANPTVGVRGKDKPLNWESDTKMSLHRPDSTYRVVVTYRTGYKFSEVKFTVNDVFELPGQPNRRVMFSDTDTTFYEATFDTYNQPETSQ